jgi:hypothetical protein
VRADPLGVVRVHDGLGSRTDGNGDLEVALTGASNPGNFGGETLDVVLFPVENGLGDEHGEVGVVDTKSLDVAVEPG